MAIWAIGVIVALNNAGYDVGALIAGLGIGGLALAMAAKDTVSNIFGGFTIFTDRPFTINDRVKVAGYDGVIREIGVRSTRLETLEGRVVTIPNSKFSDTPVENVTLEPSRKVSVNLGLTYDTTPEKMKQAMEILKEIANNHESLEEKVLLSFNAFGDFAMNILFIYYIKSGADILAAQSDINMAILDRFNGAGLEFAFPTQTLYTKQI
jgi:MscS family membrane protein